MRDLHDNDTIAVEIVVRHTRRNVVVEHRHEIVTSDGLNDQPEWRNRRIVAAIETAAERVHDDFGATPEDLRLGRERDFHTPRSRTEPAGV